MLLLGLLLTAPLVQAEEASATAPASKRIDMELDIDAYYSSAALYFNLNDEPTPQVGVRSESGMYTDLLARSYQPHFILLEASINPMPIAGVLTRKHLPDIYADTQINDDLNLTKVLTAGFEEPYALSIFGGNMVKYKVDDKANAENRGFMGYLFSTGRHHILNNKMIDDPWYELEWKIKGEHGKKNSALKWSFRVGGKWHDNPDIADVYYAGIFRDHTNFDGGEMTSLRANTGIDFFIAFDQDSGKITEQHLILDKKIPFTLINRKFALAFEIGLLHISEYKYRQPLMENNDFQLIFRPNFRF